MSFSEDMPEYKDFRKAYINAHILEVSGEEVSMDDLGLPGIHESVKRGNKMCWTNIKVRRDSIEKLPWHA